MAGQPNIAGCAGGFDVPGVTTAASMQPNCGRISGNSSINPQGTGCSVEDLCSEGWHVCTGAEDPLVPWTALTTFQNNVRNGGVNWELDIYSRAKHSFTRPDAAARSTADRSAYDAQTDRRSWRAMLDFLSEIFEAARPEASHWR